MNSRKYNIYQFPECKDIVVSGDIHGDFNLLVNKICVQYQMRNTLVIVAGDCGFGFDKRGYYDNMVKRNAKRMNDANNWIVFIRGNHDNPAYFDGKSFKHKRFIAIPDYSVINACNHSILCVGGAYQLTVRIGLKHGVRNNKSGYVLVTRKSLTIFLHHTIGRANRRLIIKKH